MVHNSNSSFKIAFLAPNKLDSLDPFWGVGNDNKSLESLKSNSSVRGSVMCKIPNLLIFVPKT